MGSIEVLSGYYKINAESKEEAQKDAIGLFLLTGEIDSLEKKLYDYLGDFDVKITDTLPSENDWFDVHFQIRAYSYDYYNDNMIEHLEYILKTGVNKVNLQPISDW